MEINLLIWGIAGAVSLVVILLMFPQILHKPDSKHYTPFNQKRTAIHPDGQLSNIDYYRFNANNKMMWKFKEHAQEVHAEIPEDIIADVGAWDGYNSFVFRKTRQGRFKAWDNPYYQNYFTRMESLRKGFEEEKKSAVQVKDLSKMSKQSFKKMVSDGFDEDFAEQQYGMEKKMFEYMMKKGKGRSGLPEIPGIEEGGASGEAESN